MPAHQFRWYIDFSSVRQQTYLFKSAPYLSYEKFLQIPFIPRFHFSYFEVDRFSLSLGDIIFPQLLFLRLWPETIESSRRNTSRYQRSQSAIRSAMSKLRWCSNFKARCGPEGTIESGSHVNRHLTGTYESNTAFHRRSCHRVTLSFCGWLFDYYYFLVYFSPSYLFLSVILLSSW